MPKLGKIVSNIFRMVLFFYARKARLERTRALAEELAQRTGQPLESLLRKSLIETTDQQRAEGFDLRAAAKAEKACDDFGEVEKKFVSSIDIMDK